MRSMSREEVRAFDARAIGTLGIAGAVLMENAGRQAADAACAMLGPAGPSAAIVAGAGNNGGDGFVVARHLILRGYRVVTFLVAPREKLTGDADANFRILETIGGAIRRPELAEDAFAAELRPFDLVIDAVGGTGIVGPLRGEAAAAVRAINAAARPVLAIDIPTGQDCDTGVAHDPTVIAMVTVTFVARKKGFEAPGADRYTGKVIVADIGVPVSR